MKSIESPLVDETRMKDGKSGTSKYGSLAFEKSECPSSIL
jgi:hypothetical protein